MKVECVQESLQQALQQAEKISARNVNLPVLSCVLIEAKKGQLILRSTNLDLGLESVITAKVEIPGIIAVPSAVFCGYISNISRDKSIKIESDESTVTITTNKSRSVIKCLPVDDFPTIPEVTKTQSTEVSAKDFVKGLKSVWYSSSLSSVKPELSSVCVYPEENNIIFVATDSFRLAEKKVSTKQIKEFERVLIPFKNVTEIIRILEQADGIVEMRFSKNQIAFIFEGIYLTSRVIDGIFPDYRQIIPKEFKTEAIVLKEDLVQSLKISTVFSDSFNQVNMAISPEDKKFQLTTKNTTLGESATNVSAALSGDVAEVNFNYRYVSDCLQSIDSDSVSISLSGPSKPVVIRGASDKSFTYLVMPMNR